MKRPALCLIFSACDLGNNDGYIGRLRYVATLLSECGLDVQMVGFSAKTPVMPFIQHCVPGNGAASSIAAALRFCFEIVVRRPSVVVFTSAGSPYNAFFSIIAALMGSSILYDCHDPAVEAVMRMYKHIGFSRLLRAFLIWCERVIAKHATLTISVSPSVTRILQARGWSGEIVPFYNIHNANLMGDASARSLRGNLGWKDAFVLVYVGGMQPLVRGLEEQFLAVIEARSRGANVRFAVAYGSGDPNAFEKLAERLRRDDAYHLSHNLEAQAVADLIAESDAAVNQTLMFALPSKIFEYIANGVSILSIDDGSDVNAVCRDFVTLFGGDVASLSQALDTLRNSHESRANRTSRGRAFLSDLFAHNASAIRSFVESSLEKRPT